jgi:hypothetical protein
MKDKQEKETIIRNHEEHVDIADRGGPLVSQMSSSPLCVVRLGDYDSHH